ncbi:MAG: restriction endonuclease subunit S [Candidatus Nanohaloarchaea archaeon]
MKTKTLQDFREDWEKKKLSEVIAVNDYPNLEKGKEHTFVPMKKLNVNQRKIEGTESKVYKYGAPRFQNGDTLFVKMVRSLRNGKTAYVDVLDEGEIAFGSTEFYVLTPKEEVTPKFVYYTMRREDIRQKAMKWSSGSTARRERVPSDFFDKTEIEIPPKEEQKQIVEILDSLDSKIETNSKINSILEEFAETLFKSWFVEFEPFEDFKDSELGKIPTEFEVGKVEDFGKVICGGTPSKDDEKNFGGDIPFITVEDIEGPYVNETEETLTEEGAEPQESKELQEGAVCVSCVATIGRTCITKERCYTNQQINSIVSKDYSPYFIYFYMSHAAERLEKVTGSGSTYNYISKGDFSKFEVLLPPPEKANEFGELVKPLMEKIKANQEENEKLRKTRDMLLPKLMSGEIRVNVDGDE